MKKSLFTLEHARQLTEDTYELVLSGDTSAITAPGQFVNIELPGKFLRRPISICNWTEDALMLLVKVVGEGTKELVRCVPGTELDVLSGLGNGFDMSLAGEHPVLVGGGIGIAPLYGLAQRMLERGQNPTIALGFRTGKDAFYLEEFAALGCRRSVLVRSVPSYYALLLKIVELRVIVVQYRAAGRSVSVLEYLQFDFAGRFGFGFVNIEFFRAYTLEL